LQLNPGGLGTLVANGSFTLSAWVYNTNPTNGQRVYADPDASFANYSVRLDVGFPTGLIFRVRNTAGTLYSTALGAFPANTWTYVTGTFDSIGQLINLYVNGTPVGTAVATTGTLANGTSLVAGRSGAYPNNGQWPGSMDELRISNTVRSASWIATEYKNQSAPSTFFSAGAQQSHP
jgi:hypothetical protein